MTFFSKSLSLAVKFCQGPTGVDFSELAAPPTPFSRLVTTPPGMEEKAKDRVVCSCNN